MTKSEAKRLKAILASRDVRASLGLFLNPFLRTAPVKPMKQQRLAKKKATREEMNAETARIRQTAFVRAGGKCEFCRLMAPSELHHLLGGTGRRTQKQSIENCVAMCFWCHRDWHRDPSAHDDLVADWCRRHGYPPIVRIEHAKLKPRSTP